MVLYECIFEICNHFCHQMPSRSFFIAGHQFPLCYRCTGLLIGNLIFISAVYWYIMPRLRVAIVLSLPMLIDLLFQNLILWSGINILRLISGICFGVGFPSMIIIVLSLIFNKFKVIKVHIARYTISKHPHRSR